MAPVEAYLPPELEAGGRAAGVAVSLYGVRSERNWGCGDLTDLRGLVGWMADMHASFLALNPLHAIENRQPYNISPYLPNSSFFRNPIYLDVEAVPEYAASALAQSLRGRESVCREIAECRDAEFVEYERVWRLKRLFLQVLHRQFRLRAGAGRRPCVDLRRWGVLRSYAALVGTPNHDTTVDHARSDRPRTADLARAGLLQRGRALHHQPPRHLRRPRRVSLDLGDHLRR